MNWQRGRSYGQETGLASPEEVEIQRVAPV